MSTILLVEDDPRVSELVSAYCRREGFDVVAVTRAGQVLPTFRSHAPNLVVLDLMLPDRDGLQVCRDLRSLSGVPIIILSARTDEADRVLGLEFGADDYVTKPFSGRELVARIKALLRRASRPLTDGGHEILRYGPLEIDLAARTVRVGGQPCHLRPREFDLLAFLATNPGRAFSRAKIVERVWGIDFTGDERSVDAHVKRLRQKLGPLAGHFIVTVWGLGYRFEEPAGSQGRSWLSAPAGGAGPGEGFGF